MCEILFAGISGLAELIAIVSEPLAQSFYDCLAGLVSSLLNCPR